MAAMPTVLRLDIETTEHITYRRLVHSIFETEGMLTHPTVPISNEILCESRIKMFPHIPATPGEVALAAASIAESWEHLSHIFPQGDDSLAQIDTRRQSVARTLA